MKRLLLTLAMTVGLGAIPAGAETSPAAFGNPTTGGIQFAQAGTVVNLTRGTGTKLASATKPRRKARAARVSARSARRAKLLPTVKAAIPGQIPLGLVDAIILKESGYNATARGSQGEIGLMQIMPSTARQIARKIGRGSIASLSDAKLRSYLSEPSNNLRFGLDYLSTCHKMAKGNIGATVGCYNAGPGNMWRWGKIKTTRAYVHFVRSHMANEG